MKILSCSCFVMLAMLLCSDSTNAQVSLISRSSFVNSSDLFFDGGGTSEMDFISGAGIYNESRSVGNIQSSQTSSIIAGVFDIRTFGQGGNSTIEDAFTEGISGFNSQFEVSVPSEFTLVGDFAGIVTAPNDGSSFVELAGGDLDLRFFSSTTSQIDTSGLLLPGIIYNFDVNSTSLGGSVSSPPAGAVSADVVLTVTAVSVPEPSAALPAIVLAFTGACRRRKSRIS